MNCPTKIKRLKKCQQLNFMWKNKPTVNWKFSSDEAGRKFLLSLRFSSVQSTFLPRMTMEESLLLLSDFNTTKETATEWHPVHSFLSFSLAMYWVISMHMKMYSTLLRLKPKLLTPLVPSKCHYIVLFPNNLTELTFSNSVYLNAKH